MKLKLWTPEEQALLASVARENPGVPYLGIAHFYNQRAKMQKLPTRNANACVRALLVKTCGRARKGQTPLDARDERCGRRGLRPLREAQRQFNKIARSKNWPERTQSACVTVMHAHKTRQSISVANSQTGSEFEGSMWTQSELETL